MPDWVVNLFAESASNPYTITFDGNGNTSASGSLANISATYWESYTLSWNVYNKTWYTFLGWSTGASATTATWQDEWTVKNLTTEENWTVTLYAIWTGNTYQVAFHENKGSDTISPLAGSMSNQTLRYDVTENLSSNAFSRSGYDFLWWSINPNATSARYTDGTGVVNLTTGTWTTVDLYAIWSAHTNTPYKVIHRWENAEDSWYTEHDTEVLSWITYDEVTPTVKSYTGFTSPDTQTVYINWNGETIVTYDYVRKQYDLTFNTSGPNNTTGSAVTKKTLKYGQQFWELADSFQSWYTFTGWYSWDVQVSVTSTMPAGNLELQAHWDTNKDTAYTVYHFYRDLDSTTYSLSWVQNLSGETASGLTLANLAYKNVVGFTYTWASLTQSWTSLPTSFDTSTTIDQYGNTKVYIYYDRNKHTVSLHETLGIDSLTNTATYDYWHTVTLWAEVNSCYTWAWWSGYANTSTKAYQFTMPDRDVAFTGYATINSYTVTVDAATWATVTNEAEKTYNCWETVTLTASANSWYTWAQWNLTGVAGSGIASTSGDRVTIFTMPNNPVSAVATVTNNTDTVYTVRHEKQRFDDTYDTETKVTNEDTVVNTWAWTTDANVTPSIETFEWFTSPTTKITESIKWDGTTVITYKYTRNSYDVTLNAWRGTTYVSGSWSYKYGTWVKLVSALKDGYENITYAGTDGLDDEFPMPAKNVVVTSTATPIWYDITYTLNTGYFTSDDYRTGYTVESGAYTLPEPKRTWYVFSGWTWEGTTVPTKTMSISAGSTGNKAYVAVWDATGVDVTVQYFKMDNAGNYPEDPTITGKQTWTSDTTVTVSWTWAFGSGFEWDTSRENNGRVYVKPDGSSVAKVYYKRLQYTVTVNSWSTGIASLWGAGNYYYNTWVTVSAELEEWYEGLTWTWYSTKPTFDMPHENVTMTAKATPTTYTITYHPGEGSLTGGLETVTYTIESDAIVAPIPTRTWYNFAGWSGENLASPVLNLTIPTWSIGNRNYYATWTAHAVKVSINHYKMDTSGAYTILETWWVDTTNYLADSGYTFESIDYTPGFKTTWDVTKTVAADGSTVVNFYYERNKFSVDLEALTWVTNLTSDKDKYYYEEGVVLSWDLLPWYQDIRWTWAYDVDTFDMPASDITMRAYATATTYDIDYELNGGSWKSGEVAETSYTVEDSSFTLKHPVKTWYVFSGWSENASATDGVLNLTLNPWTGLDATRGDKKYYAVWKEATDTKYEVHHLVKKVWSSDYEEKLVEDLEWTTNAILTFTSLSTGTSVLPCSTYSSGSLIASTTGAINPQESTTIKADWTTKVYLYYTRNAYSVTVGKDDNMESVGLSPTMDGDVYECGQAVTVSAVSKAWYHFKQWTNKSENQGELVQTGSTVTGD